MKIMVKKISENIAIYRCPATGITWVEDHCAGLRHSAHPNISNTGNVAGMRQRGWNKDQTKQADGYIYNIDRLIITDPLDEIARQYCRCGGNHNLNKRQKKLIS
jgi:hypothetical protein